jgi:hypothetical protein
MANTKISALPASTNPLAGTEVLPIVQGGATKQVSVANLTAGRAVSAASVTASTGNFVVGTSGQGIDFSATPGTGTSELLADYEEGTWTPVVKDGASGTAATATSTIGRYTKIGRMVQFQIQIENINTSGLTPANTIFITGFPFTVADSFTVATVLPDSISSTTGNIIALLYQGTVVCALYNGLTTGLTGALVSQISSGTGDLYITGVYQTN